jgi:hypothetical protein
MKMGEDTTNSIKQIFSVCYSFFMIFHMFHGPINRNLSQKSVSLLMLGHQVISMHSWQLWLIILQMMVNLVCYHVAVCLPL